MHFLLERKDKALPFRGKSFGHYEGLIWALVGHYFGHIWALKPPRPSSCNLCGTWRCPPRAAQGFPALQHFRLPLGSYFRVSFLGVLCGDYLLIAEARKVTVVTAHYLLPPGRKAQFISHPQTARRYLPLLGALPEDYFF